MKAAVRLLRIPSGEGVRRGMPWPGGAGRSLPSSRLASSIKPARFILLGLMPPSRSPPTSPSQRVTPKLKLMGFHRLNRYDSTHGRNNRKRGLSGSVCNRGHRYQEVHSGYVKGNQPAPNGETLNPIQPDRNQFVILGAVRYIPYPHASTICRAYKAPSRRNPATNIRADHLLQGSHRLVTSLWHEIFHRGSRHRVGGPVSATAQPNPGR